MIGLDTNILVRYITQDDPVQSRQAAEILEDQLSEEEPGFVSLVVMAETVWVLERVYGLQALELANAVEKILQLAVLSVQNEPDVFQAMVVLRVGAGTFSDALIASVGLSAGCSTTLTFDRKATRIRGFQLPGVEGPRKM